MSHVQRNRRTAAAAVLVVLLAAVALAGCGGSSKNSSSTSSTDASTGQTANGPRGRFGARAAALRSCLQKNGVSLPARKAGQRGGPFGAGTSGRPRSGVTRSKLQAALKKCGASLPDGGVFNRQATKQRYAKFEACMSRNGVKLPAANTSGNGPIYNTKGIDTASATFKSAYARCRPELAPAGLARPGAAGAGAPGAPGSPGAAGSPGGAPGTAAPQGGGPSAPSPSA